MENAFVYKIVNDVDNKIYIGSTTLSLSQRMTGHRDNARTNKPKLLSQHMRNIGIDHFKIQLLYDVELATKDILRECEQLELEKIPEELRLNSMAAYVCNSGDRGEYHKQYDANIRDPVKRKENKKKAYEKMMADPVRKAKELERNKLRMQRKRLTMKEPVQRLNGHEREEDNQPPMIA